MIKRFFRAFFLILLILFVALGIFLFCYRDAILKFLLEYETTSLTGFNTTVEKLHFEYPSKFFVEGLRIYNPPGFEKVIFAAAPQVYLELSIPELYPAKRVHFYKINIHIAELNIERNSQGISNVALLKSVRNHNEPAGEPTPAPSPDLEKHWSFFLNRLELTLEHVAYEDRSKRIPRKISQNVAVKGQVFENIHNLDAVVNLILLKIIYGKTFGNLGLTNDKVENLFLSTVTSGGGLLKQTTELITEKAGGLVKQTTGLTQKASSLIKGELVGKLKSTLSGDETGYEESTVSVSDNPT